MSSYDIIAYVGLLIEISGLWMVGRHRNWGWLLAVFGASLWIVYAVGEARWPVLVSTLVFGATYFNNWRKRLRSDGVPDGGRGN